MKKRIFSILICICMLATAFTAAIPVSAAGEEPTNTEASTQTEYNVATYYYDRINSRAQWCYNFLKDFYDNITDEVKLYSFDFTHMLPENSDADDHYELWRDFLLAHDALKTDNPLYVCYGRVSGCSYPSESNPVFTLSINRTDLQSNEKLSQITARVKQIADTVGEGDRYTKLRRLVSYFIDNMFYDPYSSQFNGEGNYDLAMRGQTYDTSVYGALLKGVAVCSGFAESFKVLCDEIGVPCIIMGNAGHGWNLVQMEDGGWYRIDLTNICPLGWYREPDEQALDEYFAYDFLNNNTLQAGFGLYNDPYMLNIDNVYFVTEFPPHAEGQYQYKGDATDFSYTEAPLDYDFCEPQFIYRVNQDNKTCTVIDYIGEQSGDLIIPDKIDGYTVTAIESYAFYYCTGFDGKLVIPENVRSINQAAFAGCYNLTAVEMADSKVEFIGKGAFAGCQAISEIVLPDALNTLSEYAFCDCVALESVTFGKHIVSVEYGVLEFLENMPVMKAPSGSCVEEYASANGIEFEAHGELCSNESADGKWYCEDNSDSHYQICEHGARVNISLHTGGVNCCDRCDTCGAYFCINYQYSETAPTISQTKPADCINPAYTGNTTCRCGNILADGEYVGEPDPDAHVISPDAWYIEDDVHRAMCENGCVLDGEAHYGGTPTAAIPAQCAVCGAYYGDIATDEQTTAELSTDEEVTEDPSTDEPTTDEPTTDEPTTGEQATGEQITEEKGTEENENEDHTSKENVTDEEKTQKQDAQADATDKTGAGCSGALGGGFVLIVAISAFGLVFFKKDNE